MRNKLFICVALAAAVVLFTAVVVGAIDRRDRVPDIVGYNVLSERIFAGIIASEGHTSEGLMYFSLRTADTTIEVQIGSKAFLERNGFKLKNGDMVTVIGIPAAMNSRKIVLAREVHSVNGTLRVRDYMGLPLWEGNGPTLMDPKHLEFDKRAVTGKTNGTLYAC